PAPGVGGGPGPGGGGQRPLPVPPGDGDGGGVDGGGGGRFDPGPLRPGGPARAGSAPPPSPGGRLAPTPAVAQGTQVPLRLLGGSLGGREPPPGRAGVSEERFCAIAKQFSAGKGPRKGSGGREGDRHGTPCPGTAGLPGPDPGELRQPPAVGAP